ncbi:MAG: hypothetical protein QUS13_07055 [Smithella sp.]|nr:hypothetical protein [Smithella sp.]
MISIYHDALAIDLVLAGTAQEIFDDNILSVAESDLQEKNFDFITELMLRIGMRIEKQTQELELSGTVYQEIYSMNFCLTNNYQDATAIYTIQPLETISFMVIDRFQNYPEPETFERLFGIQQGRMRYWANDCGFTARFVMTNHYTMILNYSNLYTRYFYTKTWGSRLAGYLANTYINRDIRHSFSHNANMRHEVEWDSSNVTSLYYEYSWFSQTPGGISQVHNPGAGHRYSITPQLHVEARIGPTFLFPYYSDLHRLDTYSIREYQTHKPYYVALFSSGMVTQEVDNRTTLRLTFVYQNSIIDNIMDNFRNWQIAGSIDRQLFNRINLSANIFYGEGELAQQNRKTRLLGISIAPAYEIIEHLTANLSYEFTYNASQLSAEWGMHPYRGFTFNNGLISRAATRYMRNRVSIGVRGEY